MNTDKLAMPPLDYKQNKKVLEEQKRDIAVYFKEEGDKDFSPERNRAIVEGTIKKYEAKRAEQNRKYVENIRERADAVATYFKSRFAEGNTPIERYFGKTQLAHLRGQRIMQTLKTKLNNKQRTVHLPT